MVSRARLLPLLLIAVLAPGPAMSAAYGDKPKKQLAPTPTSSAKIDDELRGRLNFAAPTAALASSPSAVVALPRPGTAMRGLSTAGLSASAPMTPLKPVGDPAPICRAECGETRIICAATDDLSCDAHWIQCVADCSASSLR